MDRLLAQPQDGGRISSRVRLNRFEGRYFFGLGVTVEK
jgi:hypothetical protein